MLKNILLWKKDYVNLEIWVHHYTHDIIYIFKLRTYKSTYIYMINIIEYTYNLMRN